MQMMNLGETSDPDNHYHCTERELVRSDSHVMHRTSPADMWLQILRFPFIFINLKVTSFQPRKKSGNEAGSFSDCKIDKDDTESVI